MFRWNPAGSEESPTLGDRTLCGTQGYATHRFYSVLHVYYLVILALDAIGEQY